MPLSRWLSGQGFDLERLRFSLRTALAACLALSVAWAIGLEHPQWSAMTVWAASQPVRELLVEKSLYRALGTLVGTAVGLLLLLATGDSLLWLVIGLALWVGLCAGIGNALHSMIAYATLLSGYSASMVALLGTASGMNTLALGADRLLTVLVGVIMALVVGLALTPRASRSALEERGRRSTARVLHLLAQRLGPQPRGTRLAPNELLSDIAILEAELEPSAAGSRRARHSARSQRAILAALTAALLWVRRREHGQRQAAAHEAVAEAALAMDNAEPLPRVAAHLNRASQLAEAEDPALGEVLGRLAATLTQRQQFRDTGRTDRDASRRQVTRHRDWIHARHAMLRTTGVLLVIGLAWVATGWSAGAYVMLGTSVMVTLFSTFENPAWIMRRILAWQAVGALLAVALRWLAWPLASAEWQLIAMLLPLILVTVVPFSHRRTQNGSMDYVMILLLLSQPSLPLTGTFAHSLALALAVVAGPLLALIAFRLIFPTNARRRQRHLEGMMLHELETLASRGDSQREALWQARLYHRVMRLVHWAHLQGEATHRVVDASLAALTLGETLEALRHYSQGQNQNQADPGTRRRLEASLRRVARLREAPLEAAAALERLARTLARRQQVELARQARHSATLLRENRAFFQGKT
ncbi:FUSC family protein [Halomonas sp. G15]|uniref:FUSC family protein n=1 Tax=Halomonas sp. G15 TaxID=2903521 RepID=UPI001E54696B|nr:FUSC family protein [Halomonas sp. G15]MCE0732533.1 FUSC family protein [Halomonas sp. G15]